jgi:hypothetical protein
LPIARDECLQFHKDVPWWENHADRQAALLAKVRRNAWLG